MNLTKRKPPRIANWLLRHFISKHNQSPIIGDFEEIYSNMLVYEGKFFSDLWYWMQVIKSLPAFLINSFEWGYCMFKSYIKIALRNLLKQRFYSLITTIGLAIGFGVFLFFLRFYTWGINPDTFHKDIDRIYNVVQIFDSGSEGERHTEYVPYPLVTEIKNEIPEVEDITCLTWFRQVILKYKDKIFFEDGMMYADTNFFSFFSFDILEGDPKTILSKPNSIVLTKTIAKKYFGNEPAIGKIISFENKADLTVTGVVKDQLNQPVMTTIYFNFLVSMDTYQNVESRLNDWNQNNHTGFIKLRGGVSVKKVDEKLDKIINKYFPQMPEAPKYAYLFPMKDNVYSAPNIQKYCGSNSPAAYIIFLAMGIFFLLIVCINFMNLST